MSKRIVYKHMARIGYMTAPSAAPLTIRDLIAGVAGIFKPEAATRRFEKSLRGHFNTRFIFLVSSGKAAFTLILQSLAALQPDRDRVLIPAYSCYSVPAAIAKAGLNVQLCDLGNRVLDFDRVHLDNILNRHHGLGDNPNIDGDADSLDGNSCSSTLAIVPTHLFGLAADIDYINDNFPKSGAFIVEDAAQSMGGRHGVKSMGTLGDISFFSLGRGKSISTAEGGVILTDNPVIATQVTEQISKISTYNFISQIRLLGISMALTILQRPALFWIPKALPFLKLGETIYDEDFAIRRMSGFQAGLANDWQKKLSVFKSIRRDNAIFWQNNLIDSRFIHLIPGDSPLPDLIRYPVLVKDRSFRSKILAVSEKQGLGIMSGYPESINNIAEIHHLFYGQKYNNAEQVARRLVTFPIHPLVSTRGKRRIITAINTLINK